MGTGAVVGLAVFLSKTGDPPTYNFLRHVGGAIEIFLARGVDYALINEKRDRGVGGGGTF